MTQDAFAAELARYSAEVMYTAYVGYIRQMAHRETSFDADPNSAIALPSVTIALRVWAEFKHWVHTVKPTVRVQYPSFEVCDRAKQQFDRLVARQLADANVEISINPPPQWVPRQYACVAASVIATPLLHMCSRDRPSCPAEGVDITPCFSPFLIIDGKHLPKVLHVMYDNGVAQCMTFCMFYNWCKRNDGTQRSPAIVSSEDKGRGPGFSNAKAVAAGQLRPRGQRKRSRDGEASSDNESHIVVDELMLEAEAEAEAELAEQAVLASRPDVALVSPVIPVRNRCRNISTLKLINSGHSNDESG
ncbi:hypothetical protein GGI18_004258, partial [Coemansia linderi]